MYIVISVVLWEWRFYGLGMNHGKQRLCSKVVLRTTMEFKSTSISAVHLSLSCASLTVAVLTEVLKRNL